MDTPRGLQAFQPAPSSKVTEGKAHAATERAASQQPTAKADTKSMIGRNIYEANGKEVSAEPKDKAANGEGASNGASAAVDLEKLEAQTKNPPKKVVCNTCGVDCTHVYYHYVKPTEQPGQAKVPNNTKYEICPRCLVEGHHSESLDQKDFVKVEQEVDGSGDMEDEWTDQETLLLLEALEVNDDDWNAVADAVGTKTREQCVMKFLQLEIEDKYLESDVPHTDVSGGPSGKFLRDLDYLAEGRMPIFHGDNPVLSVVSFMAGLAPANVTEVAVAAKRSVAQMKQDLEKQMAKIGTDKGKEKEKPTEGDVKNEDAMEVDAASGAITVSAEAQDKNPLATLPFALSAARASALASHEERHITRLVSGAVNLQLQKLDLKMKHFNDFEKLLSAERRDLQRRRQQLFMDRLNFQRRVRALEDATKKISGSLGGQGLPGAMSPEDAVAALTEAIRMYGVGKGEEGVGVRRESADGGVQPIPEDGEGFGKIEV